MVHIKIEDLTQRSSHADLSNIYVGLEGKERTSRRRECTIDLNTDERLKGG